MRICCFKSKISYYHSNCNTTMKLTCLVTECVVHHVGSFAHCFKNLCEKALTVVKWRNQLNQFRILCGSLQISNTTSHRTFKVATPSVSLLARCAPRRIMGLTRPRTLPPYSFSWESCVSSVHQVTTSFSLIHE